MWLATFALAAAPPDVQKACALFPEISLVHRADSSESSVLVKV